MNRPRIGWIFLTTVIVANGGSVWLRAQGPQPTFGPSSVSPPNIVFNTPTTVTFTIRIDTPTVNPKTVELRRVDSNGNLLAKLGAMNDVGKSGDLVADDRNFTARVTLNEPVVSKIYFRVVAAFRGTTQNAQSLIIPVEVDPFTLPRDPGEAGKQTLRGIDSDNDGVRDDVQRWIGLNYTSSMPMRAAFTQQARAFNALIDSSERDEDLNNPWREMIAAVRCLAFSGGKLNVQRNNALFKISYLNTLDRSRAYLEASRGGYAPSDDPDDLRTFCVVDPDSLN